MAQAQPHASPDGVVSAHGDHSTVIAPRTSEQVLTEADVAAIRKRGRLPKLTGKVTGAQVISISATSVSAGRYRLVVNDSTPDHNWHIQGLGVDLKTSVSGTGRTKWKVRLRVDTYHIQCDVHPATMRTSITVT